MAHIGRKIEEIVRIRKITIVSLAKEINTTRNNIYNIFKRESIDTKLLSRIGHYLNYNFFDFLSRNDQICYLNHQPRIEEIAAEAPLSYHTKRILSKENYEQMLINLKKENDQLKERLKEKEILIKKLRKEFKN